MAGNGTSGLRRGVERGRPARRPGLTLLEVILALSLMIMLLSGVYSFYATSLKAREVGGTIARDAMLTRALLERIADELRHATDIVPGDGIGFRGERDNITIVHTRMPELYAFDEIDLYCKLPARQGKQTVDHENAEQGTAGYYYFHRAKTLLLNQTSIPVPERLSTTRWRCVDS